MKVLYSVAIFFLAFWNLNGQNIVVSPYLQDVAQTSSKLMWETDSDTEGKVMWGQSPFDLANESASTTIIGSGTSRIHVVEMSSLSPGSKYYYKVVLENGTSSKLTTFKTLELPEKEQNVQFIAISDMQRDGSHPNKFDEIINEGIIPIVHSEISDSLYDLEAILIPGDLVATGGSYSQWKNFFFDKADSITGNVPIYPVPGNHEYFGGGLPNFKKYFTLPDNGVLTLEEECWYKDLSNVRIIGLNSNSGSVDQNLQLDWLHEVLDSTCTDDHIDFVFAELHHPFKSELWTPGESGFTGKLIDSLEAFTQECGKASLHFFGHTHGYSRGQSRDHKHLWINVATAGGAIDNWGEFPNADYDEFVKSQDEYGFVLVNVEAGDDPLFTIKRYSRGDQDVILDNVLRDSLTILNDDIAPSTPINIFPSGDTLLPNCIILKASAFYGEEDIHQASHWQICENDSFVTDIIAEEWSQNENFYNEVNTQANDDLTDQIFANISSEDTLFWRVRYRNQNLEWSNWSLPTTLFIGGDIDTLTANLVLNNGAENGIQNWTGDIESLNQGECGSVSPFEGNANFGVGGICQDESPEGTASQTIDLTAYQSEIDSDNLSVGYGAYLRNYSGADVPEIYVELYDANILVGTSPVLSNVTTIWTLKSGTYAIPSGVDSCIVVLKGTRNAGTDNDSYFDNIHLFLVDVEDCQTCFGKSLTDSDSDGYCDDIDCNDEDKNIYPGSLETCNGIDDNCDGVADSGNIVTWTGNAGSNFWSDPLNWDQEMVPLPCQHVIIDNNSAVTVDGDFECLSLEVAFNNTLLIPANGFLIINGQESNTFPSASILGTMTIDGRCDIKKSQGLGFDISGTLINNNKLNLSNIDLERIKLRSGGRFDSLGKTVVR